MHTFIQHRKNAPFEWFTPVSNFKHENTQDEQYEAAGAKMVRTTDAFQSDIVLKVRPPDVAREVGKFKRGGTLVSWVQPAVNEDLLEKLQSKDMTVVGVWAVHANSYSVDKR